MVFSEVVPEEIEPAHLATNESLNAIVAGMVPEEGDRIAAVGGSGDQAFALLEYADLVRIGDRSEKQIDFIKARVEALRRGDVSTFLGFKHLLYNSDCEGYIKSRNRYFVQSGRLERIRGNRR